MELSAATAILGGQEVLHKTITNRLDLIELGGEGIPKTALTRLAEYLRLTIPQISRLLPVSERTIQRYSSRDHFSRTVSEHILQLAQVAARGVEVFQDRERFLAWMRQPSTALGSNTPLSLLSSRFGTDMVLDELGRIEHGVFS